MLSSGGPSKRNSHERQLTEKSTSFPRRWWSELTKRKPGMVLASEGDFQAGMPCRERNILWRAEAVATACSKIQELFS